MDFLDFGISVFCGTWLYKKGQEDGQKQTLEQLRQMQQSAEMEMLRREIEALKRQLPPTS